MGKVISRTGTLPTVCEELVAVHFDSKALNVYRVSVDANDVLDTLDADECELSPGERMRFIEFDKDGSFRTSLRSETLLGYEIDGRIADWTDDVCVRLERKWAREAGRPDPQDAWEAEFQFGE